jgi:uncharacterized protein involved in type VI secretion and phage assembly
MAFTLYESGAKERENERRKQLLAGVLEGIVVNNCDFIPQAKVKVRIPTLGEEVLARLGGPGGGDDSGFFWTPRIDDEVLVGFSNGSMESAYLVSGLYNTQDSPPVALNPLDVISKRVIKTGLVAGVGHEVEFDDGVGQSITITTSGITPIERQQITLSPTGIVLQNLAGTIKITMDNKQQKISIEGAQIEIGGESTVQISLNAKKISIGSATTIDTAVQGKLVRLN